MKTKYMAIFQTVSTGHIEAVTIEAESLLDAASNCWRHSPAKSQLLLAIIRNDSVEDIADFLK